MSDETVWVVTAVGNYDAGNCGVFRSLQVAEAWAEILWGMSDGYHVFRIQEEVLGHGVFPGGRKGGAGVLRADWMRSEEQVESARKRVEETGRKRIWVRRRT